MLKWTLYVLLGLGGLVAIVALVGLALPKGHRASRTVTLAAPPAAVFAVITDYGRYAEWRSDVSKVDVVGDDGNGLTFRERGQHGPILYRVERADAPHTVVIRIADTSLAFGGTWTHDLRTNASGGTDLTTTEDGEVYNPIFRVMSKFFFSQTATIDAYHAALAKRLVR